MKKDNIRSSRQSGRSLTARRSTIIFLASLLLAACGGGEGGGAPVIAGTDSSVAAKTSVIPTGDTTCANGGVLVETGIDENSNGTLDASEVDVSEKVCNGAPGSNGFNALVNISPESAGANCANGGKRIDSGLDADGSSSLESAEITSTGYVCDGVNGANGSNGANGLKSLVSISPESAGANCANGGKRIDSGLDANGNDSLDNAEITSTSYVCNGLSGTNGSNGADGLNSLVNISPESAGANCANGGKRIDSGLDANGNSSLENAEIASTDYVCNGVNGTNGSNGLNALIDMNPEPVGVNCPNGGLRIDVGIDTNGNTSLDPAEITQTGFVCSGTDGSVGWQTAEIIESANGDAKYPQVVADKFGNIVAVWAQNNTVTGRDEIWSNRFVPGIGWSTAERINTGSSLAGNPQVSADGIGNVIAVWRQLEGGSSLRSIWANRYVEGVGWGTAELIDASGVGFGGLPQVVMDVSGNAIAVWQQQNSSYLKSIWSNRYVVNVGWGAAELIETDDTGAATAPQVGVDASGNAIAVWSQSDASGRYSIWSNHYLSGTGWVTAELIETVDTGDAYAPLVSVDASGNAIVVWYQYDGATYSIWANRVVAGVGWGTAEVIGAGGWRPQVSMDGSGNAIAVWRKSSRVWSSRYVVGSGWGTPERIIDRSPGTVMAPQISVDTSGNAMTVWYQYDGARNNIWATRYVVGSGWGVAQLIETNNIGGAWFHRMTMDAGGNVIVVWQQSDGFRDNIWSNRWLAP